MTPLVRIHDLCLHLNGRAILHHVDLELPRHGISGPATSCMVLYSFGI